MYRVGRLPNVSATFGTPSVSAMSHRNASACLRMLEDTASYLGLSSVCVRGDVPLVPGFRLILFNCDCNKHFWAILNFLEVNVRNCQISKILIIYQRSPFWHWQFLRQAPPSYVKLIALSNVISNFTVCGLKCSTMLIQVYFRVFNVRRLFLINV